MRPGLSVPFPRPARISGRLCVIVAVAVRKTAAVRDHRMIQQRAVAFLHRFELVRADR